MPEKPKTVPDTTPIVSTSVLRRASQWAIYGHKPYAGENDEGITVELRTPDGPAVQGVHVKLKVMWTNDPQGTPWDWGLFVERDVQYLDEAKVLSYWLETGGRSLACGLDDEWVHVLRIHSERKLDGIKEYKVQFVGYSANEAEMSWWGAAETYRLYPELVKEWKRTNQG